MGGGGGEGRWTIEWNKLEKDAVCIKCGKSFYKNIAPCRSLDNAILGVSLTIVATEYQPSLLNTL